jgi:hypothetical protein
LFSGLEGEGFSKRVCCGEAVQKKMTELLRSYAPGQHQRQKLKLSLFLPSIVSVSESIPIDFISAPERLKSLCCFRPT